MNGQPSPAPYQFKNPGVAAVLSFFYMGLGQIYNGQLAKGILFIVAYSISWLLVIVLIGMITTPILWFWGMFDAYKSAEKINWELAQGTRPMAPPSGPPPAPPV